MSTEIIGNPITWAARRVIGAGHGLEAAVDGIGGREVAQPVVNTIGAREVGAALSKGVRDLAAYRSDVIVLVLLYPVIGFALVVWALKAGQLHLLLPLAAGFPLVGPVAATGLYEMSKRREQGLEPSWGVAMDALRAGVFGPVLTLGALLVGVFLLWLYAAHSIWLATLGPVPYDSISALLRDSFTTEAGWEMIAAGVGVGAIFAAVVLCLSVVSFPMLVDRRAGIPLAVATSLAVVRRNPVTIALWGLIVAVLLALGSIPLFVGLIFVLPVLGHATWHLYRAAVTWP